jgi:hypothetical protein
MTNQDAALMVVLYAAYFFLWLPLTTWRAITSQRGRKMWQVAASLMWGGLAVAVLGRYVVGDEVRSFGALLLQAGLLLAMVRFGFSVFSRFREPGFIKKIQKKTSRT